MPLRPYQQDAVNSIIEQLKLTKSPIMLEAATGSGKSHVIAALAKWAEEKARGKVLCIAPSKELVEQNHQKFLATGSPASIFSASVGRKELNQKVVFGTPGTIKNKIDRFPLTSIVAIDECHGVTPTIKKIVRELQLKNPNLRVVGLTATPYRLGQGYIYQVGPDNNPVTATKDPYFAKCVYQIKTKELVELGYLTPFISHESAEHYETKHLKLNKQHNFDAAEVDRAFVGKGRLTSSIVADVVEKSKRRRGVMLFAANIKHAKEILESLPKALSCFVSGETPKRDREQILSNFKAQKYKYIVNVAVLTTGFDAPHVDCIALLRATESAALLQQIIGRGSRLFGGKDDCLVLDYAGNVERHCPHGDVTDPVIDIPKADKESGNIYDVTCPKCGAINETKLRPNEHGYQISDDGYFYDHTGIIQWGDPPKPYPAHFARRCYGMVPQNYELVRCGYRWSLKECPECGHENDIAARHCEKCKAEIVDPNEKLQIENARIKKDPYMISTDKVLDWEFGEHVARSGNLTLKVKYKTEYRSFEMWYKPNHKTQWDELCLAVYGEKLDDLQSFIDRSDHAKMPHTVTVKRDANSGFYRVYGHNHPESHTDAA